jgi:hypothetical protein
MRALMERTLAVSPTPVDFASPLTVLVDQRDHHAPDLLARVLRQQIARPVDRAAAAQRRGRARRRRRRAARAASARARRTPPTVTAVLAETRHTTIRWPTSRPVLQALRFPPWALLLSVTRPTARQAIAIASRAGPRHAA